jgi:hypothetical protein
MRGARSNRSGANAGEGSAAPELKTATVERREASVPRHQRVHARLDAYGTQGASPGAWHAKLAHARRVPLHPNVSRRSATPRSGLGEAKVQKPGRRNCAAGTKKCGCLTSE